MYIEAVSRLLVYFFDERTCTLCPFFFSAGGVNALAGLLLRNRKRVACVCGVIMHAAKEVGQAGRKASWVPVPNCARDFTDSVAVVE